MEPTKAPITVGRILHVHSANFRFKMYPAIVVAVFAGSLVNANVFLDTANEPAMPNGNVVTSIPVYDPLTDDQRNELVARGILTWAEWMPVQAAGGGFDARMTKLETQIDRALDQVEAVLKAKSGEAVPITRNAASSIERACMAIEEVARHINNDGSNVLERVQEILKV